MSVRRRNKKLTTSDKSQPLTPRASTMDKSREIMALERERLVRVSQEHKKVDYVLRMKRYGFKMGKAHKA